MSPFVLLLLDWFLNLLHFLIVMGLCFGWIPLATRKFHRILMIVVTTCWLGIGPLIGAPVGYCPVTHWGWRVREMRGETHLEYGYINYLTEKFGIFMSVEMTNIVVGSVFAAIWIVTILLWVRERKPRIFKDDR